MKVPDTNNWVWTFVGLTLPAFLVAYLTYGNTVNHAFTLDDEASVVKNPDVVDPSVPWRAALTHDFWGRPLTISNSHQSFRPLTTWSYRFDRWWGNVKAQRFDDTLRLTPDAWQDPRQTARVFHRTNIFLFAVASALLAVFCYLELSATPTQASWTGALFAAHPVHVEAVASITGRAEVLALIFVLLSFFGLLKSRSKSWWRLVSCGCAVASALCKETALPILLTPLLALVWTTSHDTEVEPEDMSHRIAMERKRKRQRIMEFLRWTAGSIGKCASKRVLHCTESPFCFSINLLSLHRNGPLAIIFCWRMLAGARTGAPATAFEYSGAPLRFEADIKSSETVVEPEVSETIPLPWNRKNVYDFHQNAHELVDFQVPPVEANKKTVLGISWKTQLLSSVELVAIYHYKMIVAPFQNGRVYAYDYSLCFC